MMIKIILCLLLWIPSCKKSEQGPKPGPAPVPATAPADETPAMTMVPPVKEPRPVNPRLREPALQVNRQDVEVVELPSPEATTHLALAGRFDPSGKMLYAFVSSNKIHITNTRGETICMAAHQGHPRLARVFSGKNGQPDRLVVGWGRPLTGPSTVDRISFTSIHCKKTEVGIMEAHEVLFETTSPRADPVDARMAADGSIYLAWFSEKFSVQISRRLPGTKEFTGLFSTTMVSQMAIVERGDNTHALAIGRIYGDIPGSDGGLYLHDENGLRKLPTTRGVRGVFFEKTEDSFILWAGDGWDKNYGGVAKAYLAAITPKGDGFERREVLDIEGSYSVYSIEKMDFDGTGKPGYLLKTNNQVLYHDPHGTEKPRLIAQWGGMAEPVVVDMDGDKKHEIILPSPRPVLLRSRK